MCSCKSILIIFGLLGIVLVVLGAVLGFVVFPILVENQIIQNVRLENGTGQYERWARLPFPLTFKVYMFNVTNPDEIVQFGEKPSVTEIGPFIYRQYRNKEDIVHDDNLDLLSYTQYLNFEFDEESSAYDEDIEITILNTPLQGIFQSVEGRFEQTANSVWNTIFHGDGLFHTITPRQYLFDGYDFCKAELLTGISNLVPRMFCNTVRTLTENSQTITSNTSLIRFSFFNHKQINGDGPYQIFAGLEDIHSIGEITNWKGLEYLDSWEGENSTCNRIRGRDSSIYPPFNNDSSTFDIFNTDICRIVNLEAVERAEYKGIEGIVAQLRQDTFTNEEEGSCYCITQTRNLDGELECLPYGFADMYNCLHSNVIVSFPHMLWGDENYRNTVDGLSPDPTLHRTFINVEPGTGTPLQGAKRIQFNMILRRIEGLQITHNLPSAMFPILWVEEAMELPENLVEQLKTDYLNKLVLLDVITWVLIGVGIALVIITILYCICKKL